MKAKIELNPTFIGIVTGLVFGTLATLPLPWIASMFLPNGQQVQLAGAAPGTDGVMSFLYFAPVVFAFLGFGFGFCMATVFKLPRKHPQTQHTPPDATVKAKAATLDDAA